MKNLNLLVILAEVPELRGSHTQAKSLDILMERTKEAKPDPIDSFLQG